MIFCDSAPIHTAQKTLKKFKNTPPSSSSSPPTPLSPLSPPLSPLPTSSILRPYRLPLPPPSSPSPASRASSTSSTPTTTIRSSPPSSPPSSPLSTIPTPSSSKLSRMIVEAIISFVKLPPPPLDVTNSAAIPHPQNRLRSPHLSPPSFLSNKSHDWIICDFCFLVLDWILLVLFLIEMNE